MSYQLQPLSDEELDLINIVEAGIYNFEVASSTKQTSKSGNPMAKLELRFWDNQGNIHFVFDYLVFSGVPLNTKKISHFCKSTGIYEEYKRGEIRENLSMLCGKFTIGVEDEQPNGKGGVYPKKNVVVDYLPQDLKADVKPSNNNDFNDDIPF